MFKEVFVELKIWTSNIIPKYSSSFLNDKILLTPKSNRRRLDLNRSDLPTPPCSGSSVGVDKFINPTTPAGEMDRLHECMDLFGRPLTRPAACSTSKRLFWCLWRWKAAMTLLVDDGLLTPDWLRIQNSRDSGRIRGTCSRSAPGPSIGEEGRYAGVEALLYRPSSIALPRAIFSCSGGLPAPGAQERQDETMLQYRQSSPHPGSSCKRRPRPRSDSRPSAQGTERVQRGWRHGNYLFIFIHS